MTKRKKFIKISVRNILIDVDEVVIGCKKDIVNPVKNCCMNVLMSMMVQKYNIDLREAKKRIRQEYNPSYETINMGLSKLGINKRKYWDLVVLRFKRYFYVYPDAAVMIKQLYQSGFSLYPATTNSAFIITAKLAS